MKKIFVFLAFLFTSFNVTLDAQVLWYGDPDLSVNDNFRRLDPDGNSNPTEDQCVDDLNNPPFVTKPTDPVFGKFWRITKPVSRKRAEFARTRGDVNDFEPGYRRNLLLRLEMAHKFYTRSLWRHYGLAMEKWRRRQFRFE